MRPQTIGFVEPPSVPCNCNSHPNRLEAPTPAAHAPRGLLAEPCHLGRFFTYLRIGARDRPARSPEVAGA